MIRTVRLFRVKEKMQNKTHQSIAGGYLEITIGTGVYLQVPLLLPASETLKNREIEYSIFVRKGIWMRITNAIEIVGIDLMLNPKS